MEGSNKRASDVVARYGGQEFGITFPKTDMDGAIKIAEAARCSEIALYKAKQGGRNRVFPTSTAHNT